ncbi:hypothetical protein [Caldimonas sp. KR1-144]|uniref:hypothetical protein n=1 Tax=Caldimonas sp. KR1-144 TaxID=3400911 RepID=UPI003C02806D
MNSLLRFLVIAAGLALLAVGLAFALVPEKVSADFAVASTAVAGMGTLRANLGGLFVAMGAFALAGARRGRAHWLAVPLAIVALILVLRVGHVLIDGTSEAAMRSSVVELVLVALFAASRRRLAAA